MLHEVRAGVEHRPGTAAEPRRLRRSTVRILFASMAFLHTSREARTLAGIGLLVVVFLALTGVVGDDPAAAPGSSTLYVSSSGRDSNRCSQSAPCQSFARAYQVATPGDVVEVEGGAYPAQTLRADPTKTSTADVLFRPSPGATVSLAGFQAGNIKTGVGAKHFELRDLKIAGEVKISWGTEDVTLRNIDAGAFSLTATRDVKILGGDYGPWVDNVNHIKGCGEPGCFPAEDILIEGALFHDYMISNPSKHAECMQIWPGRRVTIRNSTFRNCTDFDILVKPPAPKAVPGEITIENSFFDEPMPGNTATAQCNPGCVRGGNALAFGDDKGYAWSGIVVRYSTLLGGIRIDPAVSNIVVTGNIGRKDKNFDCQRQATFSYNVWSAAKCSASDRTAALSDVLVGSSSILFDLRLKPGSPAIGAGNTEDHPLQDIKGRLRPVAFPPDAGAWQWEPALVVAGRAIGTATIGMSRANLLDFYGKPRKRGTEKLPDGTRLDVQEHGFLGGRLRMTFRGDRVIAIATTSSYYRTIRGLGPGASLRARKADTWACRPVGAKIGKARLYVRPSRSKKPVVAEIFVTGRGFVPTCAIVQKKK